MEKVGDTFSSTDIGRKREGKSWCPGLDLA